MSLRPALRVILLLTGFSLIGIACGDDKPAAGEIALNSTFQAEFDLVDQDNVAATDERFDGKTMVIYYGFSSCPDVCPAALGRLTAALDLLGPKADNVQALFITVDPERDTPERLKAHLSYDPRIMGLTGTQEQVDAARNAMNVYAVKVDMPDSAMGYTMDHQSLFFITDRQGQPVLAVRDGITPEQLAKSIARQL